MSVGSNGNVDLRVEAEAEGPGEDEAWSSEDDEQDATLMQSAEKDGFLLSLPCGICLVISSNEAPFHNSQ